MRERIKYMLLVLMVLAACKKADNRGPLFRIIEKGKYGYVNARGHVVVNPIYFAAGDFSEGLAPVRLDGTYGYIDSTERFVIPSEYDYAASFSDGVAQVYRNDSSFYIDKTGKKLFQHTFAQMGPFINGRAFIETASHKMGVIDKQGRLLIDTLYNIITPTQYGHLIVYKSHEGQYGIVDSAGNLVVPFGKYSEIDAPTDGYYKVSIWKEPILYSGFIDTVFQLRLPGKSFNEMYDIYGEMYNGLAPVNIKRTGIPPAGMGDHYMGYIDIQGNIISNDSTVDYAYTFHDNRAFVRYFDGTYGVVNTRGKKVSPQSFS